MTEVDAGVPYQVAERAGVVEVVGADPDEVREALDLLAQFRRQQRSSVARVHSALMSAALEAGLPFVPPAALSQAQALAQHHAELLAQGAYSSAELAKLTGSASQSTVRTWLSRQRTAHALFAVKAEGRTLVPAFLFSKDGEPRRELRALIEPMAERGVDGWQLWTWLTSPSSLLSGEIPERVAVQDEKRAARAAQRFAAQIAS